MGDFKVVGNLDCDGITLNDPSADHKYTLTPSELSTNITLTLPALTSDDNIVVAQGTQTLVNKTVINHITVTVANPGSGNKFYFDGSYTECIYFVPGITYRLDISDSSNSNHPLRFSETSDGTHNSGSVYSTGVNTIGTAGSAGAYVQIQIEQDSPTRLYTYCTQDSGMGGMVVIGRNARLFDNQNASYYLNYNNFTNVPTASTYDVDHLITLSGVAAASDDLGTFTGSTISDNVTLKAALQEVETAVESRIPTSDIINSSALTGANTTNVPSSQSVIDYVAANAGGGGGGDDNSLINAIIFG